MTQLSKPVAATTLTAPMQMASGRVVDLTNLAPEDIFWLDLIENLVKVPRFNGATPHVVYTAAQHCCLLYDRAADKYKAHALLSDFHVAFFGEATRSFLTLASQCTDDPEAFMEGIAEAKEAITEVIWNAAKLPEDLRDVDVMHRLDYVGALDKMQTAAEVRDLMPPCRLKNHWQLPDPVKHPVKAWGQDKARAELTLRLNLIGIHPQEQG